MGLCAPSATRRKDGMSCIHCPIHISYELNAKRNAIFKLRWPTRCVQQTQTSDSESVKSYKFTEPGERKKADRMKRSRRKENIHQLFTLSLDFDIIGFFENRYFFFCSNFGFFQKDRNFFSLPFFSHSILYIYRIVSLCQREQSFLFHSLCRFFFFSLILFTVLFSGIEHKLRPLEEKKKKITLEISLL